MCLYQSEIPEILSCWKAFFFNTSTNVVRNSKATSSRSWSDLKGWQLSPSENWSDPQKVPSKMSNQQIPSWKNLREISTVDLPSGKLTCRWISITESPTDRNKTTTKSSPRNDLNEGCHVVALHIDGGRGHTRDNVPQKSNGWDDRIIFHRIFEICCGKSTTSDHYTSYHLVSSVLPDLWMDWLDLSGNNHHSLYVMNI